MPERCGRDKTQFSSGKKVPVTQGKQGLFDHDENLYAEKLILLRYWETQTMTADTEIWQRAFNLAHFIHSDMRVALCVMIHGMELATLKAKQQEERTGANLMKMSDCQLFQIGLLQASEFYERRQELAQFDDGQSTKWKKSLLEEFIDLAFSTEGLAVGHHRLHLVNEDFVIRYIKHLVQVTVTRNAYQVMVGVSQFLYRHGVKEMEHIHLLIDPDLKRGGVSGKSYKTSRKRIWNEMVSRFGPVLALRGKGRFHVQERTLTLLALVNDCLDHLALWDTKHHLFTDEPHQAHALIHPACYERVLKQLRIKDPTANLAIPQFMLPTNNNFPSPPQRRQPPDLTRQQLQLLEEICGKLGKRRKESEPILLSVRVDGQEQARLNLLSGKSVAVPVKPDSKIIEVYSPETDGDLLLAACWLAGLEEIETPRVIAETRAEEGQVIRFNIAVAKDGSATVEIAYRETKPLCWLALEWRRLIHRFGQLPVFPKPAVAYALAAGALALLLFFWWRQAPKELPTVVKQASPQVSPITEPSPNLTPLPGNQPPLIAENRPKPKITGGGSNTIQRNASIQLAAVERVFVQSLGEDEFSRNLREALIGRLRQSPLVVEETISPTTDAVLQRKPDTNNKRITLRLVNREGDELWQARFNQHDAGQIAEQAAQKLLGAIGAEKRKPQ